MDLSCARQQDGLPLMRGPEPDRVAGNLAPGEERLPIMVVGVQWHSECPVQIIRYHGFPSFINDLWGRLAP